MTTIGSIFMTAVCALLAVLKTTAVVGTAEQYKRQRDE